MEAIKVCMMTSVHFHDDVRIYHKEAKALAWAGYAVTILNREHEGIDENGIVFKKVCLPTKRLTRVLTSWYRFYKAGKALECNFYHFHDPELLPAGILLKSKARHVLYDAHEDTPRQILYKTYLSSFVRNTVSRVLEWVEGYAGRRLDCVIGATEVISKRFPKSVTIHNYPKLEEFVGSDAEEIPFLQRKKQACYCGSVTAARGTKEMVQASFQADIPFVLAGRFENRELENEITKLPEYKNTEYVGFLNRDEVAALMGNSICGLLVLHPLINYKESLPIKLFEYLLSGLPVIASDFPVWRELVGKECAIFVDPLDVAAIGKAIRYLADNPDIAKNMGETGKKLVLKKYTFENESNKLLECYHDIWEGTKTQ